ncbi:DMT family transporter [Roseomonas sp. BU-1]|uniref:DMT family transporter n=2 Tax=Falsiroseomonas selenitidurans TaxID=2716335 RepID=A0ABX1DXS7_9PROT|nr:DMT family transporter [Falsiroseomonas selenitidurans]
MPAAARPDPRGLLLLLVTVIGWGFNWPAMKLLLVELPPFSMRIACVVIGVALLLGIALARRERLGVPAGLWGRLVLASLLNVTAWMGAAALSLVWLAAGEATIVCYTMPVWASIFAWALLGEPPTPRRLLALALGLAGLLVLVLGQGVDVGLAKLPGVAAALTGAVLFSLGTVVTKRWPVALPPTASAAWQLLLGSVPLLLGALLLERPDFGALSAGTWAIMLYGGIGPLGLCYLAWFAALRRLPAAAAASGTLLTPVIGVGAAALLLGEPIGVREVVALSMTIGGVVLAIRG